jgi:hypothetical protein
MAISFPSNPTLNQTYTHNSITWTYNGIGWTKKAASSSSLPTQTNNSGKYLTTDGSSTSWGTISVTPAAISDQPNSSTGYFDLPMGTTLQRPGTAADGYTRFNTDLSAVELYYNNMWNSIAYVRPGYSAGYPATSATQLATLGVTLSGNYWITIDGTATQCYVDFSLAGGPYILAMVTASTGTTYGYDSTVWTSTSGGLTTALNPASDTDQVHKAFYSLSTTRTGLALYQPSSAYFHYLDHSAGSARNLANSSTPPTAVTPNSTTIAANNIIPSASPAKAVGWWDAITAAGYSAQSNGTIYYRYGYAHGTPDPSTYGYCRFGFTADQDSSDSRDRGIGIGIKNGGDGPVGSFSASAGRFDFSNGSKNNLRGYLYIKN